jgi:hypothetical protein
MPWTGREVALCAVCALALAALLAAAAAARSPVAERASLRTHAARRDTTPLRALIIGDSVERFAVMFFCTAEGGALFRLGAFADRPREEPSRGKGVPSPAQRGF